MGDVQRGDQITAVDANGDTRELRALGPLTAGGDFAVVWACSVTEWDTAEAEGREAEGIPWPAEDIQVVDREPAPA